MLAATFFKKSEIIKLQNSPLIQKIALTFLLSIFTSTTQAQAIPSFPSKSYLSQCYTNIGKPEFATDPEVPGAARVYYKDMTTYDSVGKGMREKLERIISKGPDSPHGSSFDVPIFYCLAKYVVDTWNGQTAGTPAAPVPPPQAYQQKSPAPPTTWQPPANVLEGPASNTAFSLPETQEAQDSPARHAAAKKEIQDFDNLVKKRRKGEDASYCVKGPFPNPGFWIFKNACPFNINFAYCNYKPTPDSWESAIDCEKGQFGSSDIEAHGERAAHAKASPGGTFGAACKDPSFPVKLVFLGNRINADCF